MDAGTPALPGGDADCGVMAGIDPNDLAQAGWGVIIAFEDEASIPALREALEPLRSLRQSQAGERCRDAVRDPKFFYSRGAVLPAGVKLTLLPDL